MKTKRLSDSHASGFARKRPLDGWKSKKSKESFPGSSSHFSPLTERVVGGTWGSIQRQRPRHPRLKNERHFPLNRTISYTLAELFLCAVKVSRIYHNPDLDTYQVLIKSSPASSNFSISCSLCLHETLPCSFSSSFVSGRDTSCAVFHASCVYTRHYLCSFSCSLCLHKTLPVQFFMQLVSTRDRGRCQEKTNKQKNVGSVSKSTVERLDNILKWTEIMPAAASMCSPRSYLMVYLNINSKTSLTNDREAKTHFDVHVQSINWLVHVQSINWLVHVQSINWFVHVQSINWFVHVQSELFTSSQSTDLFTSSQLTELFTSSQSTDLFASSKLTDLFTSSQLTDLFTSSQSTDLFTSSQSTDLFTSNQPCRSIQNERRNAKWRVANCTHYH